MATVTWGSLTSRRNGINCLRSASQMTKSLNTSWCPSFLWKQRLRQGPDIHQASTLALRLMPSPKTQTHLWDEVSLRCWGWSWTCSVVQPGFELANLMLLSLWWLELQTWTTWPGLRHPSWMLSWLCFYSVFLPSVILLHWAMWNRRWN